jgi:hypothetical protein
LPLQHATPDAHDVLPQHVLVLGAQNAGEAVVQHFLFAPQLVAVHAGAPLTGAVLRLATMPAASAPPMSRNAFLRFIGVARIRAASSKKWSITVP